ncbi:hypothetical protein F9B74_00110 [Pelistega sp. NLN82]|uniref:Uncharacterized protein n=1 Tax=Pelistega ratti TaxID=2652177 RepID=A0A6L9Y366_9BURK|nr:hypothetical protein [Pelistega ratti]NEN74733.1 hypothetical protein [Pelistega ratti]
MNSLELYLIFESEGIRKLNSSRLSHAIKSTQTRIHQQIIQTALKKDIYAIIANEKAILSIDLERNANSHAMKSSLKNALYEFTILEKHLKLVENPLNYKGIDEAYCLPKNRRLGLPYDEARQAFASHITRLRNMDKVRSSDQDKQIIKARHCAIKTALEVYKEKQYMAIAHQ